MQWVFWVLALALLVTIALAYSCKVCTGEEGRFSVPVPVLLATRRVPGQPPPPKYGWLLALL